MYIWSLSLRSSNRARLGIIKPKYESSFYEDNAHAHRCVTYAILIYISERCFGSLSNRQRLLCLSKATQAFIHTGKFMSFHLQQTILISIKNFMLQCLDQVSDNGTFLWRMVSIYAHLMKGLQRIQN